MKGRTRLLFIPPEGGAFSESDLPDVGESPQARGPDEQTRDLLRAGGHLRRLGYVELAELVQRIASRRRYG